MPNLVVKISENDESREYFLDPHDTILKLKEKISNDLNHSVESLKLQCKNIDLDDDVLLDSCEFNDEILLTIKDIVSLNIKTDIEIFESINNYTCNVSKKDKITTLKEKISKLLNISVNIISLRFDDIILENSTSFEDYNLFDGSSVELGVNVFILEMAEFGQTEYAVKTKFLNGNKFVHDLISEYCLSNDIDSENVKIEHQNIPLSDVNILELIKDTKEPILILRVAVQVRFFDERKKCYEFRMFSNETIADLRYKLKTKMNYVHDGDVLIIDDRVLENHIPLKSYGMKNIYEVFVGFPLTVHCDDEHINIPTCYVHSDQLIIDVKKTFASSLKLRVDFINLLIGLDELDNSKTIGFYGINTCQLIELKIGMKILIFAFDDIIEYFLQPSTRLADIRQYLSFKARTSPDCLRLAVNDQDLRDEDDLIEIAIKTPDLIMILRPEMKVRVIDHHSEIVSYPVADNMTVAQLKEVISTNSRIVKESIGLQSNNNELCDDKTLDFYRIDESTVIRMAIQDRVTICDDEGQLHQIFIEPIDTIKNLKVLLSFKIKTDLNEINLFLEETFLENHRTIDFYKIHTNSLLYLKIGIRIRVVIIDADDDIDPNRLELICRKTGTIKNVKNMLFSEFALNTNEGSLFHNGVQLVDDDVAILDLLDRGDVSLSPFALTIEWKSSPVTILVCNLTDQLSPDFVIVSVSVDRNKTIGQLKQLIVENHFPTRVECDSLCLSFLGDVLVDTDRLRTAAVYPNGLVNRCVFMLKSHSPPRGVASPSPIADSDVINVATDTRVYRYLLDNYDRVSVLTRKLRDDFNVPVCKITLTFHGAVLGADDDLRDFGVTHDSTIVMTIDSADDGPVDMIDISVRYALKPDGGTGRMSVRKSDRVDCVKRAIADRLAIDDPFVVTFDGEIMVEANVLASYGLADGSVVEVCHSVLVKQFVNASCDVATVRRFPIVPGDRVSDLKSRIAKKQNIDKSVIELNFHGEYLENEWLLSDAEVENESYIVMITSLKGGGGVRD